LIIFFQGKKRIEEENIYNYCLIYAPNFSPGEIDIIRRSQKSILKLDLIIFIVFQVNKIERRYSLSPDGEKKLTELYNKWCMYCSESSKKDSNLR